VLYIVFLVIGKHTNLKQGNVTTKRLCYFFSDALFSSSLN
jgi:hypothetical protein